MSKNGLGTRMKTQYENRTKHYLPRRTYTIIRLDGKAFHTYTRGLAKPIAYDLMKCMDLTAERLLEEIQGAKYAYVQSDEISLLLTDFDSLQTQAWFDGRMDKILSVSASVATAWFNEYAGRYVEKDRDKLAFFDARVFTIPDRSEVINYFIHRAQDCVRNSISMHAQSLFSHTELMYKNVSDMEEMIKSKGENWWELPVGFKYGRLIPTHTNYEGYVMETFKFDNKTLQSLTPTYDLE